MVFQLREVEGFSAEETARSLNLSVLAVKAAAPCVGGEVSRQVRPERSSCFAQDARCGGAAARGASALAETRLVAAAKRGDETAFRELVKNHKSRICLHAFRIMGNSEDAEDVRQLALLKAFLHLREFKGQSSFSTWITRIAIKEALRMRRGYRRGPEVPIEKAVPGDEMRHEPDRLLPRPCCSSRCRMWIPHR